jgi:hypothetical protein
MRTDDDGRLLAFLVLFVLPTGAMPIATGGHDIPVLAALLAAFVLADRGDPVSSGLAGGAALAMRQTTILALPFLWSITAVERRVRAAALALLIPLGVSVPLLVWDVTAFVEDVVRFPLGVGTGRSSARTPTLGSALLDIAPDARGPITIGLVVAIVAIVAALVTIRPPRTTAQACVRTAAAYAAAIALAPSARFGYVVYPISLLAWAAAFVGGGAVRSDAPVRTLETATP